MGYGYLSMGLTMCGLTVTLSIKVKHLEQGAFYTNYQLTMIVYLFIQHLSSWIPYLNIALIFSVICMYGLGPCKFFWLIVLKL